MFDPRGVVLITAGAYVGAELAAEFGRLPPAFLPVGNRRLLAHQRAELAGRFDRILMSLPADFTPEPHDREMLAAAGVELIFVPRGLDLPASILHAIAESGVESGPFAVLHGDTLIYDIDYALSDALSIAESGDSYDWAGARIEEGQVVRVFDMVQGEEQAGPVLSGFFHFADLNLLILSLAASRGRFVDALDRYVTRRPMAPLTSARWLDFGHLHTYYSSRSQITTERAFNGLAVHKRSIAKSSSKADRMEAEAHWYEAVPPALRIFLPQYLGRSQTPAGPSYALEFLFMASLADLFTFGSLPKSTWVQILDSCDQFLGAAARYPAPAGTTDDAMAMYLPKTLRRLDDHAAATGIDLKRGWRINGIATPSLAIIARESAKLISPPEARHLSVVHGDSCFSNILYDFRSQSVRVIDPRGQDAAGQPSIWGDNRYDLAKLYHSACGLYDLIIAGLARVNMPASYEAEILFPQSPSILETQAAFDEVIAVRHAADMPAIEAIAIHLFLSMLPLHADSPSRQQAMVANALRLWVALDGKRGAA